MTSITFKADALKKALETFTGKHVIEFPADPAVRKATGKTIGKTVSKTVNNKVSVHLTNDNREVLLFLLDSFSMSSAQYARISSFLSGGKELAKAEADSVLDCFIKMVFINESEDPVLETKIINKWYPVKASVEKFKTMMGSHILEISPYAQIGGLNYNQRVFIGEWDFEDADDKPTKRSINELLQKYNLRVASPEAVQRAKELNSKLLEYGNYVNQVFDAWGTGLVWNDWWGWGDVNLGWNDSPATTVIEPTLENKYANRENHHDEDTWSLPFVRVFSLKHKAYVFADVENLKRHEFHRDGKDKIVLPKNMLTALDSIFTAKHDSIFGDIFHGRHGGIVVLANGPSGVGKTLTAEVFAEYQERPLYTMEMGEIGTNLQTVEQNLSKIFARAKKWNAVLLFDEADIFLSERVASDLERSAIVGIFLRLLDYYEGTFFLTTNRGEGIDKAFKSRVTLYLDYPDLTPETRLTIWQNMLKAAKIEVSNSYMSDWNEITQHKLNGRQIRNQVRLLTLMFPNGNVSTQNILETMKFAAP